MVPGPDGLPELGDLPGLRKAPQVTTLGVGDPGAQRAAAEQPHRPAGQHSGVLSHELAATCVQRLA